MIYHYLFQELYRSVIIKFLLLTKLKVEIMGKKMKWSLSEIESENVLSKNELFLLTGGGTCGFRVWAYGKWQIDCGVAKSDALLAVENWGGNWCCDSCGTSTYCAD